MEIGEPGDALDELVRAAFEARRAPLGSPSSLFDSLSGIEPERVRVRLPLPVQQGDERPVDPRSSELPPEADERGRYEIAGELARGGIGVVLRARDTELGRDVAMKLLRTDRAHDARALRRFLEEAQICGQLEHPGVVPVHDVGVSGDGRPFFTMKLVEGRTLGEVFQLARRGAAGWTITRALGVLQRVCDALAYAHERGVVHRDLKPANVLVGEHGEVYVTDWGLARILGRVGRELVGDENGLWDSPLTTREGEVLGTPAYMPLEQAEGRRELGPEADVYAVGAMLYHLLAGRAPYSRNSAPSGTETLRALRKGPPPRLHRIDPAAPAELVAVCERAMARDPRARYPDVGALKRDLAAFVEGRVVSAHARGPWQELRKWVQRNRALAMAIASAVALLAGGLVLTLYLLAVANAQRRNVLRLSAFQELEGLRAEADDLWPIRPDRATDYRGWLARAHDLVTGLEQHRRTLAALGERTGGGEDVRWWRDQLEKLVAELEAFADSRTGLIEGVSTAHGWGIARRLERAERIEEATVTGADAARRWREAIAAIAASPLYEDLVLEPQLGLLPIGPDPGSGLWEFAHVLSGEVPERDARGRLDYGEEHGIVLVLLPGGSFWMGAQNDDPNGPNYDPWSKPGESARRVRLEPFLMSKFETTQAQWLRMTGGNPSGWQSANHPWHVSKTRSKLTTLHPVEQVDWFRAVEVLGWFELDLPTLAQGEYAARGGTSSPWYTGQARESLAGHVNLADASLDQWGDRGPGIWGTHERWLDDGYFTHAPVGSYAANPFGLHDVLGNVEEWCKDVAMDAKSLDPRTGLMLPRPDRPGTGRLLRGGSFMGTAIRCRSARVDSWNPRSKDKGLGIRAARQLDRKR